MIFSMIENLDSFVKNHNNRQVLMVPVAVFLTSLLIIGVMFLSSGAPVKLGMEFEGGSMIAMDTHDSVEELENQYSDYPLHDLRKSGGRVTMQFGPMDSEQHIAVEEDVSSKYSNVEIRQIGPVYGESLQRQALMALLISFIGMAAVVYLIFRTPVPSLVVIASAVSDITIAMALMNITGIELSFGTVAALLMIIGYSVDSDILLNNRLLKRKGNLNEKITRAMHTGVLMTTTTLVAVIMLYLVSTYAYLIIPWLSQVGMLSDIAVVLIFGLVADLMNTWMFNTGVLRWYLGKGKIRRSKA
ncbi:MAG: protein translocase subunit SecF [Methanohalobium sp.]|uniref:protein translocase subunit SecF n=1 Tax=Methanohalobium sp. TaxID=2837493 RepID=UPI00397E6E1C